MVGECGETILADRRVIRHRTCLPILTTLPAHGSRQKPTQKLRAKKFWQVGDLYWSFDWLQETESPRVRTNLLIYAAGID